MSADLTPYEPRDVAPTDPTGGRLVAWAQAASAAHALATSLARTAFVPQAMRDPDDATAAILMGDELGLSPLAALRSIYVVHGSPAMYARTMVALAQSHGHEVWTETSTPTKVIVCGRRRGSEHVERSEWTTERARRAGYTSNKKYESSPQEMLYAKAAAEVCRRIAADTLAGVPYSVEDLDLEPGNGPTRTVTRSTSAPTAVQRARPAAPEPDEPPLDEPAAPVEAPAEPDADAITTAQQRKMGALMREVGITERDAALQYVAETIGREVASRSELTKSEASAVIEALAAVVAPADDPTLSPEWADAHGGGAA